MLEEFEKYVSNYDINNRYIKLKYDHSYRVMNLSRKYAEELGFSKKDIELATLIGLLHDFGRFEQFRVYNSFNDMKTIDHADYSVSQLFDKNEIERYTKNKEDYGIIEFAIKNHNKHHIPSTSDERMLMHAKLIRDTDKIDIIYLLGNLGELDQKGDDAPLSNEILDCIIKYKPIDRSLAKNKNERITAQFAFAFDIYNDICLKELKNNYKYYYKQIDQPNIFKEVYEIINNYMNERIDNHVRNKI